MATQAPLPSNPGQIADDPLAPLRLQTVEQINDFWKRYDRLADIHEKTLTSNLDGNLDVLLIFAALFSAINTAFISITMPDLSPSPSDDINNLLCLLVMRADNNTLTPADVSPPFSPTSTSIIVNCLLYASLSCSLLAAVGAMMAKEWLQSFKRSGQTGPLEDQGKLRQRKFNGVEEWHLEAVIKFLPNLLLLSVILFFAGIGLFLFPINTAVAVIVIAFSGLGMILSGMAIVAGASSPLCPYQSAASNAVRRTSDLLSRLGRILSQTIIQPISRKIIHPILAPIYHLQNAYRLLKMAQLSPPPEPTPPAPNKSLEINDQVVTVQAACWLLQTTSFRADQVAVARFIRGLSNSVCTSVFENSRTWRRLVSLTCEALEVFDSQVSEGNRQIAEVFGQVSCHMPLPVPEDMITGDTGNVFDPMPPQKASCLSKAFLQALGLARAKYEEEDQERVFHLAFLSTLLSRDRMIKEYQWADLSKLFLVDESPRPLIADNLLGVWAYGAYRMSGGTLHEIRELEELMEIGGNTELLTKTLSHAIDTSITGLESVREQPQLELNAARGYVVCLRRARDLARELSDGNLHTATWGVTNLVIDYFDPMIASDSGNTPVELVKLSKEAVLGLHDFIDTKASENGSSTVGISESEQLLDHHLVSVAADILMWDPDIYLGWIWKAESVKPSIVKILLWIWKNMSKVSTSDQERRKIFLSSCQLWAPLEKYVEISRTGKVPLNDSRPFMPDDLKRITEFIEYIRKDRANFEFISRNADVGINRLYLPFEQVVDWEYKLFDFREPRRSCCRSSYLETKLL